MKMGLDDQALQEQRGQRQPDQERMAPARLNAQRCPELAQAAPDPATTLASDIVYQGSVNPPRRVVRTYRRMRNA